MSDLGESRGVVPMPLPSEVNHGGFDHRTHEIKTWPESYQPVLSGQKTFELRLNDRDYRPGDEIVLREWEPRSRRYTGRFQVRKIGFIFSEGALKPVPDGVLDPGWVILSLIPA